jgi:hypothetical protein
MSTLGNKSWDYNTAGVAHYGMLADFLQDVQRNYGTNGGAVYDNVMSGADYFLQTWKICEAGGVRPTPLHPPPPNPWSPPTTQFIFVTGAIGTGSKMGMSVQLRLTNGTLQTFSDVTGGGWLLPNSTNTFTENYAVGHGDIQSVLISAGPVTQGHPGETVLSVNSGGRSDGTSGTVTPAITYAPWYLKSFDVVSIPASGGYPFKFNLPFLAIKGGPNQFTEANPYFALTNNPSK